MMKAANTTKNQPRSTIRSLKNGNASEVAERRAADAGDGEAGDRGDHGFDAEARLAGEALVASAWSP